MEKDKVVKILKKEAPVDTARDKPSKAVIPDDVDLSDYELQRIFPYSKYAKKELKALKIPARRDGYLMVCEACSSGLNDIKSTDHHISIKSHKLKLKEYHMDQALSQLPALTTSDLDILTHFVETTFQSMSAAAVGQLAVRRRVGEELQELVQKVYPDVTVQLHGSSASEFAVVTSNINLNLDIPAALESQKITAEVMNKVVGILESNDSLYTDVIPDYYSFNKIPRLLFKHRASDLSCEIRTMVGNPMMLAPLLQCYSQADKRTQKLGVVFLHWAKLCELDVQELGYYPGHMFVVMVIHFLQQTTPPVLPVLHELPKSKATSEKEEEDVPILTSEALSSFSKAAQAWRSENKQSLGELWIQFLRYYSSSSEFPVSKLAVSIRQSGPLLRETRQWGAHRLAVEDPMIPKSNLGRCVFFDKIFEYYLTCLKQTTVYFYKELQQCKGHKSPSKSPPPPVSGIQQEDSSIVFATSGDVATAKTTPTDPSLPLFLGESTLEDNKTAGSAEIRSTPTKLPSWSGVESDVSMALDGVNSDTKGGNKDEEESIAAALRGISFGGFPAETTPLNTDAVTMEPAHRSGSRSRSLSPVKIKPVVLKLSKANCVLLPYPKVCVICKQAPKHKHTYKNCPNEALPDLSSLSIPRPKSAALAKLGELFREHMKEVSPNHEEKKIRQQACDFILKDVRSVYPNAHLRLFGSSANNFGSYASDLDICLIIPELKPADNQTEKQCHCEVIEKIAKELRQYSEYEQVVSITSARVPIVKFSLARWQLECDISMENRLAMRNTDMLKAYSVIDERVRILGYAVKTFAKECDMGDASSGSLSSYAYILLMLRYLQQTTPPVVPVLQQLHPGVKTEGPVINNWNCYYFEFDSLAKLSKVWSGLKKNRQSVGELWLGFLRFVLTFDWNKQVVTIRQLEPLLKFDKWWISKPLCIEDPFNLDHNLGANVSGKMRTYILERLQGGLMYHSSNISWEEMGQVMSREALVGDSKAPKFLICHYCNLRGHRQSECPTKANDRRGQSKNRRRRAPPSGRIDPPPPARTQSHPGHGVPSTVVPMPPQTRPLLPAPFPQAGHQGHFQRGGGRQLPVGMKPSRQPPEYRHMHSYPPPPHAQYQMPPQMSTPYPVTPPSLGHTPMSPPYPVTPPSPGHTPMSPQTHYNRGAPMQRPNNQGLPPGNSHPYYHNTGK